MIASARWTPPKGIGMIRSDRHRLNVAKIVAKPGMGRPRKAKP
jgi:hypothetical protein